MTWAVNGKILWYLNDIICYFNHTQRDPSGAMLACGTDKPKVLMRIRPNYSFLDTACYSLLFTLYPVLDMAKIPQAVL